MAKIYLNDQTVAALVCPPEARQHLEVFDTDLKGFYVDVLRSGRKSFRLRYRVNGKLHVTTLGDAAVCPPDEARAMAEGLLAKAKAGVNPLAPVVDTRGPTVEQFFLNQYLSYVKTYKRSWDTDLSLIRTHLGPPLGHLLLTQVKESDIADLVNSMKHKAYAPGTCNRVLVLLRYGYALALRWGIVGPESNPMLYFKNLVDDNKIEHFLTADQAQRLLSEVRKSPNEMLQWIVLFLLYTGGRKREVLDAKWSDIDWERRSWRIPKTKSGKVRHVPLSAHALEVLAKVKALYGHQAFTFIFPNVKTGLPYVGIFCSWDAARQRADLGYLRIHDLRHSFASFLVNAGRSLYEVQEILGHADIRTTSRYAHLSRERLQEAVEVVPSVGPIVGPIVGPG